MKKFRQPITPLTAKALIDLTRENENLQGAINDIFLALVEAKKGIKRDSIKRFPSGHLSQWILMEIYNNIEAINEHFKK